MSTPSNLPTPASAELKNKVAERVLTAFDAWYEQHAATTDGLEYERSFLAFLHEAGQGVFQEVLQEQANGPKKK